MRCRTISESTIPFCFRTERRALQVRAGEEEALVAHCRRSQSRVLLFLLVWTAHGGEVSGFEIRRFD